VPRLRMLLRRARLSFKFRQGKSINPFSNSKKASSYR
jgi:hypothetical protein